jgi:hypothetical protein
MHKFVITKPVHHSGVADGRTAVAKLYFCVVSIDTYHH